MSTVTYEVEDGIGWIRFNRPEVRNACSSAETQLLVKYLTEASGDDQIKGIVVGSTSDTFCAGADLDEMVEEFDALAKGDLTITGLIEFTTEGLQQVARITRAAKKPVIASVDGYAVGAGCEIALDCDLIVAAEGAKFGFPEAKAGMSITGGVTKLLAQSIGVTRTRDLFMTGRLIEAGEALSIGMINRVAPPGENDSAAVQLLEDMQMGAPLSVIAHKRMVQQSIDADLETAYNLEKQTIGVLCTTEDAAEAARAFTEKRDPMFKGQ